MPCTLGRPDVPEIEQKENPLKEVLVVVEHLVPGLRLVPAPRLVLEVGAISSMDHSPALDPAETELLGSCGTMHLQHFLLEILEAEKDWPQLPHQALVTKEPEFAYVQKWPPTLRRQSRAE